MNILQFDTLNCRNCYKCVRHCPVKAIEVRDHRAQIRPDECILCGECTIVCPQKTKDAVSEMDTVAASLKRGTPLIASVAPSFFAYFNTSFESFRDALIELGFGSVYETAEGAYLVKSEYEKLIEEQPEQPLISSCCSSVNQLVYKYYPEMATFLAPVMTPAQAHAARLKEQFPNAQIVFISPCIAKKSERYMPTSPIDYLISFEELTSALEQNGISFNEPGENSKQKYLSRHFPTDGGIVTTLKKTPGHRYVSVSGYDECIETLQAIEEGRMESCFIEMSLCKGSCIGGPSFRKKNKYMVLSKLEIKNHSAATYEEDYSIHFDAPLSPFSYTGNQISLTMPSDDQIHQTMLKMGKHSIDDELNCGMCGYSSCREKAAAIIAGKAEINMCLPYMNERAESFSNQIISLTPNAILSVDLDLKVQQINTAACGIFKLSPEDILKQPVSRIMDEYVFVEIIANGTEQLNKTTFLPDYNVYLEQVFLFSKESGMVVCVMKDISQERKRKNLAMKKKIQAAAMADDIADKQLRIVHEIASLLGETAAETKIAIHDLKGAIMMEDEE